MNKIARSKIDITPKGSVPIAGHAMRTESSSGVHDALEVHVLLLDVSNIICCFMNADLIGTSETFVNRLKQGINDKYGIDKSLIVFSVNHTHSGPYFGMNGFGFDNDDASYENEVYEKTMYAVDDAFSRFVEFDEVVYRQNEVKGFYGNRNSVIKPGDEVITVVDFKRKNKSVASIINMSCHSTVLNPLETKISADLLGNVRRELSKYYGYEPFMSNGNAGDISTRLYRHDNDFNELKRVTTGIAAHISGFNDKDCLNLFKPKANSVEYIVNYDQDVEKAKIMLAELTEKLNETDDFDSRKWLLSEIAGCNRKISCPHVYVNLNSTIIRLGDLELIVVPCELASAFGRQIKACSNAKCAIVWGYANGVSTYVVQASEFNGGHDGISTRLKKGQAEEYVGKIIQALF